MGGLVDATESKLGLEKTRDRGWLTLIEEAFNFKKQFKMFFFDTL